MELTDIFVGKLVGEPHTLRLMFHRLAIHNRLLELLDDGLVNGVALGYGE